MANLRGARPLTILTLAFFAIAGSQSAEAFLGFGKKDPPKAIPVDESQVPPKAVVVTDRPAQQAPNKIDLESSATSFKMSSGGTSCYVVVQQGGKDVGAFVPHNSATNPNTEAAYHGLAAALGLKGRFQVGVPHQLGSAGIRKFRAVVASGSYSGHKATNCSKLMGATAKNPSSLNGVYKVWGARPYGYDEMVSGNAPKSSHAVVRALQAGNSWPSKTELLSFKGASARTSDIAAAYGVVVMFDALFGQWDRYSGGNVTMAIDGKSFYVYTADNGGASPSSSSWASKNISRFSRFPREVVEGFNELEAFLEGRSDSFAGYKDPNAFVRSIGLVYDYSADSYRQQLLKNLKVIRAHVQKSVSAYGESKALYRL